VITRGVPDTTVNVAAGVCGSGSAALTGLVDDLVVNVDVSPIDGVGGILGVSGSCLVAAADGLPRVGSMHFDSADVAGLVAVALFFLPAAGRALERLPENGLPGRFKHKVIACRAAILLYREARGAFARATVLAVRSGTPILPIALVASHRFWRNAGLSSTSTTTLSQQSLGYEWDEDLDNGARPAGMVHRRKLRRNL
jgi:hypothetical protein